ncbi:MAG TPA: alpha/beta fold hydrolase [Actinomycetota bacterium]|nr:alpha/beta fold hydrolase [Actinomycetota bacterium]
MREDVVRTGSGIELAVADHGGEGHPVVLVHGLGSNLRTWDAVAPLLANQHRVVAYDQRGHGRSTDPPDGDYSVEALVDDLDAVVDAFGLQHPYVVGHSWGASVALGHAISREGCPGIVCVDGGVIDLQDLGLTWELTEQIFRPPHLEGPPELLTARIRSEQSMLPWNLLAPVVERSFVVGEDGIMRRRTSVEDHMAIVRQMWEARVVAAYDRVRCPVMCVLAQGYVNDEKTAAVVAAKQECARRLGQRHPWVRIEWLESLHDVQVMTPGELVYLIRSFTQSPSLPG